MNKASEPAVALDGLRHRYTKLMEEELRELRLAFSDINQAIEALPDNPTKPYTIPAVFRRSYDENFISDYLAFILDPDKNGIGAAPLKSLLSAADFDATDIDVTNISIEREFIFPDGGRIDLLIETENEVVIGIENKILSSEGKNQTISYARSIEKLYPENILYLIFLTPGDQKPSSSQFHHLSYTSLLKKLCEINPDIPQSSRSAFYWEDFLLHLEVYIAMAHQLPDVSEKSRLYMDNIQIIQDIRKAFEQDSQQLYDYLSAKIASSYEGKWVHEKSAGYQALYKSTWRQNDLVVFFIYRFDKEILRKDSLVVSLEVQGQKEMWKKSPLIAPFIETFHKTNPKVATKLKSTGLLHLPTDRNTYIASKTYQFDQDPTSIDAAFSEVISDFAFLVDPVDRTIEAFNG